MKKSSLVIFIFIGFLLSCCNKEVDNKEIDETTINVHELQDEIDIKNKQINELSIKLNEAGESLKLSLEEIDIKDKEISELNSELSKIQESTEITNQEYPYYIDVFSESILIVSSRIKYKELTSQKLYEILGEPIEIKEYLSEFDGFIRNEVVYDEASFTFTMHEGKENIKCYTLYSSKLSTNRGITIGSNKLEVIEAYGNYYFYDDYIAVGEKTGIKFKLNDDIVTEICVWFEYE